MRRHGLNNKNFKRIFSESEFFESVFSENVFPESVFSESDFAKVYFLEVYFLKGDGDGDIPSLFFDCTREVIPHSAIKQICSHLKIIGRKFVGG